MCLIDCGVENCAVRFVILLMKNVAKSSAVRVDEGGGGGGERREENALKSMSEFGEYLVMIVCPFSSGDISREVREKFAGSNPS